MARPTNLPIWATTGVIDEPALSKKQRGWEEVGGVPEDPPYEYFNWWQNNVYTWVEYWSGLTDAEFTQLKNIDSVEISNAQWGYLGGLDQSLSQASSPTFASLTVQGQTPSAVQWGYLANMNQAVYTSSNVTFNSLQVTTTATILGAATLGAATLGSPHLIQGEIASTNYILTVKNHSTGAGSRGVLISVDSASTNRAFVVEVGSTEIFGVLGNGVVTIGGSTGLVTHPVQGDLSINAAIGGADQADSSGLTNGPFKRAMLIEAETNNEYDGPLVISNAAGSQFSKYGAYGVCTSAVGWSVWTDDVQALDISASRELTVATAGFSGTHKVYGRKLEIDCDSGAFAYVAFKNNGSSIGFVGQTGSSTAFVDLYGNTGNGVRIFSNGVLCGTINTSYEWLFADTSGTYGTILKDPGTGGIRISSASGTDGYLTVTGNTGYYWNATQFRPFTDDGKDLGSALARWRDIYAGNATIQTSDKNLKSDIKDSNIGLNFFRLIRGTSFRMKGRKRTHHGLIAQEVEAALLKLGLNSQDAAMIVKNDCKGGVRYSLRYGELWGPLVSAINEMANRIESLEKKVA